MPNNTDEENLDIPPGNQSENTPNEVDPSTNREAITQNEEIEIMEVHHHAHDPAAPHHKKNWKNYFWEFLMLFLAVFCGFLAEYHREHTIEKDREKQYIASMMADMVEDSTKLNVTLQFCNRQVNGFDSLLQNIYNRPYTDSSLKVMYRLQLKYTHTRSLTRFTKRTITQLKNSGGLRLIRNKAASDTIILYSEDCEQIEAQGDYIEKVRMGKINDYSIKLFDNQFILNDNGNFRKEFFDKNFKISLLSDDEKLIREYANALTYARSSLKNYISMQNMLKGYIPERLKFFQDKYSL